MHLTILMMIVTTTTVSQTTNRCSGTSDRRKHRLSRLRTFSRSGSSQTTTAENEVLRMTKFLLANRYQSLGLEGEVDRRGRSRPGREGDVEFQGDRFSGVHVHVASVHRLYRCFTVGWLAALVKIIYDVYQTLGNIKRKLSQHFIFANDNKLTGPVTSTAS